MKKLSKDQKGLVFEVLIAAAMAVVILFALLNIGSYINGTISDSLVTTETSSSINNTLENVSEGFGSTIDLMVIASIITVITVPLAAVIAVRRLM